VEITYLGHAGFCVETDQTILIMDPWMSSTGAFDSSWFQYPRNHHLSALIDEKLGTPGKQRLLYISHEHKDHFDPAFLNSLANRDFSLVLAAFRRPELRDQLAGYRCAGLIACGDGEQVPLDDGFLKLYLDDSELNRDSAILVHAAGQTFFNMNDCKIYDRIGEIARDHSPINVLASQFSGATWHPTCYAYPREKYEAIARDKRASKFESVGRSIETLAPAVYLPSAGPPCFLDPRLKHINFEPVNIFPRAPEVVEFLKHRITGGRVQFLELMPGDVLDASDGTLLHRALERVEERGLQAYIESYAREVEPVFQQQRQLAAAVDPEQVLDDLAVELKRKLKYMILGGEHLVPLYFELEELAGTLLQVDFERRVVERVPASRMAEQFYSVTAPAWQFARVLSRDLTWEDFALTFRARLQRNPDSYHTLLNGFLYEEAEDLTEFCRQWHGIHARQERFQVTAGNCIYTADRLCPHQGGDLSHGWVEEGKFLVCPRHRWKFDLTREGRCTTNNSSIHASPEQEDTQSEAA
jgi:UDP-MurNAc hydroxylase